MKTLRNRLAILVAAAAFAVTGVAAGCGDDEDDESASQEAEQAVEEAGQAADEAGQEAEEAGQDVGQAVEGADKGVGKGE
jgi:hypothetical protein